MISFRLEFFFTFGSVERLEEIADGIIVVRRDSALNFGSNFTVPVGVGGGYIEANSEAVVSGISVDSNCCVGGSCLTAARIEGIGLN